MRGNDLACYQRASEGRDEAERVLSQPKAWSWLPPRVRMTWAFSSRHVARRVREASAAERLVCHLQSIGRSRPVAGFVRIASREVRPRESVCIGLA